MGNNYKMAPRWSDGALKGGNSNPAGGMAGSQTIISLEAVIGKPLHFFGSQ
jgi:hypothetical protein